MRVLGVDIQGNDLIAVILDGTATNAAVETLNPSRIPFPKIGADEAENLLLFENQLIAVITQARVESVGIIRALGGMYSASPTKVKIECLVQLAAKHNNRCCLLLTPQAVTKAENLCAEAGGSVKTAIEQLQPKYLQRAAYCAWSVLDAHG